ncbi:hypothetical protein AB0I10_22425 [Streptomyces sp. NPDC050636]|uniref:hypothetical protein n=1 Tax=Streptomyces sp. NPDC050636 TaxID=3154510 RepID=UPI0034473316
MQMTEAFATTVAAVAPVIVLAGIVEWRPHFQWVRNDFERYLAGTNPTWKSRPRFIFESAMFSTWLVVLILMVFTEYRSLRWLATNPQNPQPDMAEQMLHDVALGMAVLIFMPLARYLWWAIPAGWRLLRMPRAAAAAERDEGDSSPSE